MEDFDNFDNNVRIYMQDINLEFKENGVTDKLTEEIRLFTLIIKDDKIDPFWSDSAKSFLKLLIISNLLNGTEIDINNLLIQLDDINTIRNIILNNENKLENSNIYKSSITLVNSDKTLKSILEIIKKSIEEPDELGKKIINETVFNKKLNKIRDTALIELSSWSGRPPNYQGKIITKNKEIYIFLYVDSYNFKKAYISKIKELNDDEYNKVIKFIKKERVLKENDGGTILDVGMGVTVYYKKAKKTIENNNELNYKVDELIKSLLK